MELRDLLIARRPPDRGGAIESNRSSFQKNWALYHLIELHETGDNYMMVFEHHDDILVLDSDTEPSKIDFYQVKTRVSGDWTLKGLLARSKKPQVVSDSEQEQQESLSILGTLYRQRLVFEDCARSLNVISNARFKITLESSDDVSVQHRKICASEFNSVAKSEVATALAKEHLLAETDVILDIIHLAVTPLSITACDAIARDALGRFLENYRPNVPYRFSTVYRTVIDEITRQTNSEWLPTDFDDLIKTKSISKKRFQDILDKAETHRNETAIWQSVESRLNAEGLPFPMLMRIKSDWRKCEIELMDHTNIALGTLRKEIKEIIAKDENTAGVSRCLDLIDALFDMWSQKYVKYEFFSEGLIKALILRELYESW